MDLLFLGTFIDSGLALVYGRKDILAKYVK